MDIELIKRMMDACYQGKRIRDMLPPLPDGVSSSYIQYLESVFYLIVLLKSWKNREFK